MSRHRYKIRVRWILGYLVVKGNWVKVAQKIWCECLWISLACRECSFCIVGFGLATHGRNHATPREATEWHVQLEFLRVSLSILS